MAEMKTLNTRIKLRIDTLENWNKSSATLLPGEIAFASIAASEGTGLTEPVIMAKIATEEGKTFAELPWAFHAKAADVLAACKSEASLKAFINGVIADAGIASSSAMEALAGRVTTAEGDIATLKSDLNTAETGLKAKMAAAEAAIEAIEGRFGADTVALEINAAINALNLGATYAAKSLETTVADHVADTVAHVTTADKTKWNGALQASDIASGATNGTIAVKGTDVAITGLGSAAFTESSAYDASGAAAAAESAAKAYAKEYADGLAGNYDAKGAAAAAQSAAETYAKNYADGLAGNYDASGAAAQALVDAKAYTDEFTGGKTVAESINAVIANYSTTEQMNTAIATAKGEAVKHADDLDKAMDERVQALEAIDHSHTFVESELNLIQTGDVAKWNAAEQNAKDYADGLDEAMDGRVAALEAKFTGDDSVADQISDAVAAEATLRAEEDGKLQDAIDAIEADYLKAADKTALQDQIDVLDGLVGDETVAKQITDVTDPLADRVKAVEDDYLKAADKTELEGKITANANAIELLTNGVSAEEVDGVNDLIQYVKDHGTEVTGMKADIKAASDAAAAEKTRAEGVEAELQGAINGVAADVETLEGEVAKKAAQTDLDNAVTRIGTAEGKITTLEGEMDAAEGRLDALETKVGDKTVSEQIEAAITDAKADASNKDAVVLAEAQKGIAAVDGRVSTLETEIVKKTNDADLAAVAKSGLIDDLSIGEGTVLIFDCGNASV